jgi:hypothetical protein
MDFDKIILTIHQQEVDREYFTVVFIKPKKYKVPVAQCPQCDKPFIPTSKSPLLCIFCMRINEKQALINTQNVI